MIAKLFLASTGSLYVGLAVWCTVSPQTTSEKIGFSLKPGSGQSEFLVIYGGLELAMAILFLLPLVKPEWLMYSLVTCVTIHGCLVAFRTATFFMYSGISSMTAKLAIGEWAIFLIAAGLLAIEQR